MSDMRFLLGHRMFVFVANRFMWTGAAAEPSGETVYWRTNCGVRVHNVDRVRRRGIEAGNRALMLELLSITLDAGSLHLIFAGGAEIELSGDSLLLVLEDIDDPWPTRRAPAHRLDDA